MRFRCRRRAAEPRVVCIGRVFRVGYVGGDRDFHLAPLDCGFVRENIHFGAFWSVRPRVGDNVTP